MLFWFAGFGLYCVILVSVLAAGLFGDLVLGVGCLVLGLVCFRGCLCVGGSLYVVMVCGV